MLPSPLRFLSRRVTTAAVAAVVTTPLLVGGPATTAFGSAAGGTVVTADLVPVAATVRVRLRTAVRNLRVATETRAGYDRDKFRHWIDADGDCQDTRDEVLKQESRVRVSGCDVRTGKWFSYYDRKTWTASSDVDIDHVVALAEAWDSGAKRWNADTRERYANDLGDRRSLIAVTDNVNQAKSDQDPSEWLPTHGRCRYVAEWTAVKTRWSLKVNRAEKNGLVGVASRCPNIVLKVRKARINRASTGGSGGMRSYAPISTWKCPSSAPIKGNEPSMIYHPPSSPWYDQTSPEQCFATEAGARAAGFRRARY